MASLILLSVVKSRQHVYVLSRDKIESMLLEDVYECLQPAVYFFSHGNNKFGTIYRLCLNCTAANATVPTLPLCDIN